MGVGFFSKLQWVRYKIELQKNQDVEFAEIKIEYAPFENQKASHLAAAQFLNFSIELLSYP